MADWKTSLCLATAIAFASGCSTYVYKEEVSSLANAAQQVALFYDEAEAYTTETTQPVPDWRRSLEHPRASPLMPQGCTAQQEEKKLGCKLYFEGEEVPDGNPIRDEDRERLQQDAAERRAIITALTSYSASLKLLVDASQKEEFAKASQELFASCSAAKDAGYIGDCAKIEAAGGILTDLFSSYLDRRRFQTLKASLDSAQTVFDGIDSKIATGLEQLQEAMIERQSSRLTDDATALKSKISQHGTAIDLQTYEAARADLVARANAIAALMKIDPKKTVGAFVDSHRKLKKAVDAGAKIDGEQLKALSDSLAKLKADVDAIAKTVEKTDNEDSSK